MAFEERLRSLRPQCADIDPDKGAGIEAGALASILAGPNRQGQERRGDSVLGAALTRHEQQDPAQRPCPFPQRFKGRVEGVTSLVNMIYPSELADYVRCICSRKRAEELLLHDAGKNAALQAVIKRHASGQAATEALAKFEGACTAMKADLQVVALAAGVLDPERSSNIRWTKCPDVSPEVFVAADDAFRAQGISDPSHDWDNWLEAAVQRKLETLSSASAASRPIFLRKRLNGHSALVRVINRAAYELMLSLYIEKGKLHSERLRFAWILMERIAVGDSRIAEQVGQNALVAPALAREFVLSTEELTLPPCSSPSPATPANELKKRHTASIGDGQDADTTPLSSIAAKTGLSGQRLKLALINVSHMLVSRIASERGRADHQAVAKELKAGSLGQNTSVPKQYLALAEALLADWNVFEQQSVNDPIPCHGPVGSKKRRRQNTQNANFLATTVEHVAAKDLANAEWIRFLREAGSLVQGPLGFLDAFSQASGFHLRTTEALLAAGALRSSLFSANPDAGIVKQLRNKGVSATAGLWQEALPTWPLLCGVFLDLCTGSSAAIIAHLTSLDGRCLPGCILGYTICHRDFDGEMISQRILKIIDLLSGFGWLPARLGQLHLSSLPYRSSAGQAVMTQFWRKT